MKKIYLIFVSLIFAAFMLNAQDSYLTNGNGFVAEDILTEYDMLSTFDIKGHMFYGHTGDTIIAINMEAGEEVARYGKPSDYSSFPSFIFAKPEQGEIWAGFTVTGNTDDRIYRINTSTGEWEQIATLAGNFDLVAVGDSLLVSAAVYGDPNKIYILDTTGNNNHRVAIETGGYSAGMGTDNRGNLFYATSMDVDNFVCSWTIEQLYPVIQNTDASPLILDDAGKLTDIPFGAYDCEVDDKGNLAFNINNYSGDKILAVWNGVSGNGNNYDTLALATGDSDWFTMVKTRGDFLSPGTENGVFTLSYTRPVAKVNGTDYAPELVEDFDPVQAFLSTETMLVPLSGHFTDPDNDDDFTYSVASVGNSDIAGASIVENDLQITVANPGQTTITIEAQNAGRSVTAEIVVGAYYEITGDYTVADFENLELGENDYWNGSDGSGGFESGNIAFGNTYDSEYGSWGEWAYSTMADDSTAGYANQYSAITAAGFDPIVSQGATYGISYASSFDPPAIKFTDNKPHEVKGFFVTNSTYAALSMMYGDAYAKKFGGATGLDPDWLKLSVFGFKEGEVIDTVDFYLADFRFNDSKKDYVLQTWQWVELSQMGYVDSLQMSLSSSDIGDWGMNTPAYYCADNFYVGEAEVGVQPLAQQSAQITVYPNPAQNYISISTNAGREFQANLFDATGKLIIAETNLENGQALNIADLPKGMYVLQVHTNYGVTSKRIIKD